MKDLTPPEVVEMLRAVAQAVIEKTDVLTEADMAIGDGDHGVGMRRGFTAALVEALDDDMSIEDAFRKTGMAIMSRTGGAAGAVFGTFFRGGAGAFSGAETLNGANFADFLAQSTTAVCKRGGVEEGAKTMVDAVMPAARAVAQADAGDLTAVMAAAEAGALQGVEASKGMVATTGKARSLGERSVGHPDPGAISVSIILGAMASHVAGR